MNTNFRKILRRKVIFLFAAFFSLITVISACKKEETEIGDSLQTEGLNVLTTDTFTLVTYSDVIDSMESDETSVSLLGAYNDPVFGGVNCGIVTQIVPEGLTQDFPDVANVVMDSVVIALDYSSINYYPNLDDFAVEVYEIGDVLTRLDQEYYTKEEPTILGENLVIPELSVVSPDVVTNQIVGTDTLSPQLRIHLDPQVGLDLIADSKAGLMGADFQNTTFKGLYIRAQVDEDAPGFGIPSGLGTVLYFALEDPASKMTIYYHNTSGVAGRFDFDINSNCARYNKITYERAGTAVEQALLDKTKGEQAFYMQGGSIRAVVEIPHIMNFNKNLAGEDDPKIINKAVLVLPIQDFQFDAFDPATSLFIARIVDKKLSTFTADYGFGTTVSGNTVTYDEDAKEFRFSMTREIQSLLNGDSENVGYRIYAPAFFASTIERIIFNGSKTTLKNKPRLEITYTEY